MSTIPHAPFSHLRTLWFQLAGTRCNLSCTHCFLACSPTNQQLGFLAPETVYRYLDEAAPQGLQEVYVTGGEPFLHKQLLPVLRRALQTAPTTVLTNGTLMTAAMAKALATLQAESRHVLEIRVSLDDVEAARNDAVRGRGALAKAVRALRLLQDQGLVPLVAVTEYLWHAPGLPRACGEPGKDVHERVRAFLLAQGVSTPRLKVIPVFTLGRLAQTPPPTSYVTAEMLHGFDCTTLQCTTTRVVADDGLYACPILVGHPGARLSRDSLQAAMHPCALFHTACHTCYVTGMTCANS